MKSILLFGAGKSATCLIDYLLKETVSLGWQLIVVDGNLELVQSKIGNAAHAKAIAIDVKNNIERQKFVESADIVISLLPPGLHFLIATDCLHFGKHLLNASYVDAAIRELEPQIKSKKLLFLCEMGLDPGIDHMSAMQLIDKIKSEGGSIHAFRSHTGGLVAPESDDNPWHYKISWNPRNVVMAGSAGAVYLEKNKEIVIGYPELFRHCRQVAIPGLGSLAWYPNRDSLSYIPLYGLQQAATFIRTTLRYPVFCDNWLCIAEAGLTNDQKIVANVNLNIRQWASDLAPFVNVNNQLLFESLGFFDETPLPVAGVSSAAILQSILETKWQMQPEDKDMIVMLHELEYTRPDGTDQWYKTDSWLIVKGENNSRTAMAKTVGLPLGIAAILLLQGKLNLTGLHIPILPEIYHPVLKELENQGICFQEQTS